MPAQRVPKCLFHRAAWSTTSSASSFDCSCCCLLVLVIALTVISGIPDNEDGPDFYTLLLGATIGMMLMVSANNLLIFCS